MSHIDPNWYPMPECRYPMEYHRRYCGPYPGIEYDMTMIWSIL